MARHSIPLSHSLPRTGLKHAGKVTVARALKAFVGTTANLAMTEADLADLKCVGRVCKEFLCYLEETSPRELSPRANHEHHLALVLAYLHPVAPPQGKFSSAEEVQAALEVTGVAHASDLAAAMLGVLGDTKESIDLYLAPVDEGQTLLDVLLTRADSGLADVSMRERGGRKGCRNRGNRESGAQGESEDAHTS